MRLKTLKYRIKDSSCSNRLAEMGHSVNFVWNYCNEITHDAWSKFRKMYTAYDLHKMTAGCSKDLGILAQSVCAVCDEYDKARRLVKKSRISWRSKKRSLGWIPFKSGCISISGDCIKYNGHRYKIWLSRPINGYVRSGSFNQNSKGQWFVNIVIEDQTPTRTKTGKSCGIDLGLKTLVTLSDGVCFTRDNITGKMAEKLATSQRARKKKRFTLINCKIKNQRKDWAHKVSSLITTEYDRIIVGNITSFKLRKTKMAKSSLDAGWSDLKQMLAYKAIRLGVEYKEVNESYSTITCSACLQKSGPRGLSGLGVREWICNYCGMSHDRDINAAKNILRIGHDTPIKGVQA